MNSKQNALYCALIALCVLFAFSDCYIKNLTISRFNLIESLDLLYNPALAGKSITVSKDPSACLQSIPKETFVQNSIAKMQLPLWNNKSGCGQPLIADPSNTLFCPLDLVFSPANHLLYKTGIIFEVILAGIFSFFFFRVNGVAAWAACLAALGYALSAVVLNSLELADNYFVLPILFLSFQSFMADGRKLKSICIAAMLLALCYFSVHPEVYFVGTMSALFLWIFSSSSKGTETDSEKGDEIILNLKASRMRILKLGELRALALLGLLAIAMAAPMMFPFLEYLRYASSYKYSSSSLEYIPFSQLAFYFSVPRLATFFPGFILLLGLPLGFVEACKKQKALLALTALLLLFQCRPGSFESFFASAPFSYLLPEYTQGVLLLLFCLVGAGGLSKMNFIANRSIAIRFFVGALSLLPGLLPLLMIARGSAPANISALVTSKQIIYASIVSIVALFILLNFRFDKCRNCPGRFLQISGSFLRLPGPLRFRWPLLRFRGTLLCLLPLILIIANFAFMLPVAKDELPRSAEISVPPPARRALIDAIKRNTDNSRFTACGIGLLPPATGLLYGLSDFRSNSPLNLKRYTDYIKAAGARVGYCNMVEVPERLNQLYDLAGVDVILAASPVRSNYGNSACADRNAAADSTAESDAVSKFVCEESGRIMPGLRLKNGRVAYFPQSADIEVILDFKIHDYLGTRYSAGIEIVDQSGRWLWRSHLQNLTANAQHECRLDLLAPVPAKVLPESTRVKVLCYIHDAWSSQNLLPDGQSLKLADGAIVLGEYSIRKQEKVFSPDRRFELIYESDDLLRVYKNRHSLGRVSFVPNAILLESSKQALARLSQEDFRPGLDVVVEKPSANSGTLAFLERCRKQGLAKYNFEIARDEPCEIEISCDTAGDGVFVLHDSNYPGWQAEVDGKEVPLLRCNYLFKGVALACGTHKVVFRYRPWSFYAGLFLCFLAWSFSVAILKK